MNKSNSSESPDQFSITRKKFIAAAAAGLAVMTVSASPFNLLLNPGNRIKAIAFDAFPIFDTRPIFLLVENMFPGKGVELGNTWRTKQFEYSWLRATAGQYNDFWRLTEDALVFATKKAGVTLSAENKKQLMGQYLSLNIWPDGLPVLQTLQHSG